MKLQYLGTAAAEGIPAIFCRCAICQEARALGGRNLRSRSQAIIDDKILIDMGPDTYFHAIRDGLDLSTIHTCLITHVHGDHLLVKQFDYHQIPYGLELDDEPLMVYGSAEAGEFLNAQENGSVTKNSEVIFKKVTPYESFEAEGYTITPVPAAHGSREPLLYIIQHEGKTLFYAHDTGRLHEETWEYLKEKGIRFDFVSLDCTEAIHDEDYYGHMNFKRDWVVRDRMLAEGVADDKTRFCANHFSHNGQINYDKAIDPAINGGMEISYDGMIVEF